MVEKHGEGGFSFVYKVVDGSGRQYALKRILLADRKAREAAQREVTFLQVRRVFSLGRRRPRSSHPPPGL